MPTLLGVTVLDLPLREIGTVTGVVIVVGMPLRKRKPWARLVATSCAW